MRTNAKVLAILTERPDHPTARPLELADLPADEEESGSVELREIGDLKHVNLLAGEQSLSFEPGINVVFGLNGSGKSGYGRLLRRICRAAHKDEVLRDVFDPGNGEEPQTARLKVYAEGEVHDVEIDLAQEPDRLLSAMSIFDAGCAEVYLSRANVIEHVPKSLHLLRRLAEAQGRLTERLTDSEREVRERLPSLPEVESGTEAARWLSAVGVSSDLDEIRKFATLSENDRSELKELEVAAAAIKADQSRQLEKAMRTRARAADEAVKLLEIAGAQLGDDALLVGRQLRERFDAAVLAEEKLADKAFSDQRVPGTGQGPWREMWESARRFVEAGGGCFPDTTADGVCPTCQQELDDDARERMEAFEGFVQGDLRERIEISRAELESWVLNLPDIAVHSTRAKDLLVEAPDEIGQLAEEALEILSRRAAAAHEAGSARTKSASPDGIAPGAPPPLVDIDALAEYAAARHAAADEKAALRDVGEQERIATRLAELRARDALTAATPVVTQYVKTLRLLDKIGEYKAQLVTTKISNKLRKLQRVVITDRLRKAIEDELDGLDPVAGRVEVVEQASRGETKVSLHLKEPSREQVGNVLSDGEQRALALAFFLAEIAVSEQKSAIVFDDPVSSLDHQRRTYIARRLVEESSKRQVIVFTHDFSFVYLLQEAAEQAGRELHGQTLQRANGHIGVVSDELPTKTISPSRRRKDLRRRLEKVLRPMYEAEDPIYEREADTWTADLRKAYDQLIEDYVLAGTVRRWHAQVRIRQLRRIKWSSDIVERIEAGMKKTSLKTHHEASELQPGPFKPAELTGMLAEFDELCRLTHPEGKQAQKSASAGAGKSEPDKPVPVEAMP